MKSLYKGIVLGTALVASTVWGGNAKVCFEAETFKAIEPPMTVKTNGCDGASGAFLEIAEGVGNPPKLNSGKAEYEVEIPEDGAYILWARVEWNGECSNSFTVMIDGRPPILFGEDMTFHTWHWVKYPVSRMAKPITLEAGKHKITFANREDGVRIDQILLTTNRRYTPMGIEETGGGK